MILRQDYSNIPIQQKGLHSEGLDVLRLSKDCEGLISNYQRLIDATSPARRSAPTRVPRPNSAAISPPILGVEL